jgi:hypothetical protein
VGFCDGQKVALGQVFSENFGFPYQSTFTNQIIIIITIIIITHGRRMNFEKLTVSQLYDTANCL